MWHAARACEHMWSYRRPRVARRYGVDNAVSPALYEIDGSGAKLTLEDRVHVHFQRTNGRKTEICTPAP